MAGLLNRAAFVIVVLALARGVFAGEAEIAAVTAAVKEFVTKQDVAGVVTLVATPEKVVHFSAVGHADVGASKPMALDTIFWIASMTKPVTASAILMLQDEGKLSVDDPVEKYVPELGGLKTAAGVAGKLTIRHLMTHTSGLAEASNDEAKAAKTLAELIPHFAKRPLQFEPGAKWQYCQSGINTMGRIVEIVSGMAFQDFLQKRFFEPLGMKDTTFYPAADQRPRLVTAYKAAEGKLTVTPPMAIFDPTRSDRFPAANGGLYSTAGDYAKFCQMILNNGSFGGKQYIKPESVKLMTVNQTGELKTGFTDGNCWGLGWCVIRQPQGVSAMLSAGTFGHGGAWGTQAWIDPEKKLIYVLMVQRSNFPNSDASDLRKAFQGAAAGVLVK